MATPEPPSPTAIAFPGMVRSPSKEQNAHGHPYPIKTTSTAILSRSNSITSRSQLPLVYTPSPSPNAKPLGRSQSRGHGRSGSLSNITPPLPLPLPAKRRDSQGSVQQDIPPTPDPEAIAQLPVSEIIPAAHSYMLLINCSIIFRIIQRNGLQANCPSISPPP